MNRKDIQNIASKGRYGDTTLMHVNPSEIEGLGAFLGRSPTVNPETGLPEAFVWWVPLALAAVGGGIGAATSEKGHRLEGALAGIGIGATVGIGLGGAAAGGAAAGGAGGATTAGGTALMSTTAIPQGMGIAGMGAPHGIIFAPNAAAIGSATASGLAPVAPVMQSAAAVAPDAPYAGGGGLAAVQAAELATPALTGLHSGLDVASKFSGPGLAPSSSGGLGSSMNKLSSMVRDNPMRSAMISLMPSQLAKKPVNGDSDRKRMRKYRKKNPRSKTYPYQSIRSPASPSSPASPR